ncbi:MAG: hypothetical protein HY275_13940 [Gemmatimonadetes bacterium]|nr:hypothetical protein [Gemmatimonadota bacterium]
MSAIKLLAFALIVAGIAGLAYRGFTYTKSSDTASVGPLSLTVRDREHVSIPLWAGVAAIAAGVVILATGAGTGRSSRAL